MFGRCLRSFVDHLSPGVHAGCSEAGIARGTEGQGPGQDHHDPAVGEGEDDEVPPAAHEEECGSDPGEGVWVCDLGGGGGGGGGGG